MVLVSKEQIYNSDFWRSLKEIRDEAAAEEEIRNLRETVKKLCDEIEGLEVNISEEVIEKFTLLRVIEYNYSISIVSVLRSWKIEGLFNDVSHTDLENKVLQPINEGDFATRANTFVVLAGTYFVKQLEKEKNERGLSDAQMEVYFPDDFTETGRNYDNWQEALEAELVTWGNIPTVSEKVERIMADMKGKGESSHRKLKEVAEIIFDPEGNGILGAWKEKNGATDLFIRRYADGWRAFNYLSQEEKAAVNNYIQGEIDNLKLEEEDKNSLKDLFENGAAKEINEVEEVYTVKKRKMGAGYLSTEVIVVSPETGDRETLLWGKQGGKGSNTLLEEGIDHLTAAREKIVALANEFIEKEINNNPTIQAKQLVYKIQNEPSLEQEGKEKDIRLLEELLEGEEYLEFLTFKKDKYTPIHYYQIIKMIFELEEEIKALKGEEEKKKVPQIDKNWLEKFWGLEVKIEESSFLTKTERKLNIEELRDWRENNTRAETLTESEIKAAIYFFLVQHDSQTSPNKVAVSKRLAEVYNLKRVEFYDIKGLLEAFIQSEQAKKTDGELTVEQKKKLIANQISDLCASLVGLDKIITAENLLGGENKDRSSVANTLDKVDEINQAIKGLDNFLRQKTIRDGFEIKVFNDLKKKPSWYKNNKISRGIETENDKTNTNTNTNTTGNETAETEGGRWNPFRRVQNGTEFWRFAVILRGQLEAQKVLIEKGDTKKGKYLENSFWRELKGIDLDLQKFEGFKLLLGEKLLARLGMVEELSGNKSFAVRVNAWTKKNSLGEIKKETSFFRLLSRTEVEVFKLGSKADNIFKLSYTELVAKEGIFELLDSFFLSIKPLKELDKVESWLAVSDNDGTSGSVKGGDFKDSHLDEVQKQLFVNFIKAQAVWENREDIINEELLTKKLANYWAEGEAEEKLWDKDGWGEWIGQKLTFSDHEKKDLTGDLDTKIGSDGSRIQQVRLAVLEILQRKMVADNPNLLSVEEIRKGLQEGTKNEIKSFKKKTPRGEKWKGMDWMDWMDWIQELEDKINSVKNKLGIREIKDTIERIDREWPKLLDQEKNWLLVNSSITKATEFSTKSWIEKIKTFLDEKEHAINRLGKVNDIELKSFADYISGVETNKKGGKDKGSRKVTRNFLDEVVADGRVNTYKVDRPFYASLGKSIYISEKEILEYLKVDAVNAVAEDIKTKNDKDKDAKDLQEFCPKDDFYSARVSLKAAEAITAFLSGWEPSDLGFKITEWKEATIAGKDWVWVPVKKIPVVILKRRELVNDKKCETANEFKDAQREEILPSWEEAQEAGMDFMVYEFNWTDPASPSKLEFLSTKAKELLRENSELYFNYFDYPDHQGFGFDKKEKVAGKDGEMKKLKKSEINRVEEVININKEEREKVAKELEKLKKLRDAYLASLSLENPEHPDNRGGETERELARLNKEYLAKLAKKGEVKIPEPTYRIVLSSEAACRTLQQWLDFTYKNKEAKAAVKVIDIAKINQEREGRGLDWKLEGGELDLTGFKNLERLIGYKKDRADKDIYELANEPEPTWKTVYLTDGFLETPLTSLDITDCPKLIKDQDEIDQLKEEIKWRRSLIKAEVFKGDEAGERKNRQKLTEAEENLEVAENKIRIDFSKNKIEREDAYYRLDRLDPTKIEAELQKQKRGDFGPEAKNLYKKNGEFLDGNEVGEKNFDEEAWKRQEVECKTLQQWLEWRYWKDSEIKEVRVIDIVAIEAERINRLGNTCPKLKEAVEKLKDKGGNPTKFYKIPFGFENLEKVIYEDGHEEIVPKSEKEQRINEWRVEGNFGKQEMVFSTRNIFAWIETISIPCDAKKWRDKNPINRFSKEKIVKKYRLLEEWEKVKEQFATEFPTWNPEKRLDFLWEAFTGSLIFDIVNKGNLEEGDVQQGTTDHLAENHPNYYVRKEHIRGGGIWADDDAYNVKQKIYKEELTSKFSLELDEKWYGSINFFINNYFDDEEGKTEGRGSSRDGMKSLVELRRLMVEAEKLASKVVVSTKAAAIEKVSTSKLKNEVAAADWIDQCLPVLAALRDWIGETTKEDLETNEKGEVVWKWNDNDSAKKWAYKVYHITQEAGITPVFIYEDLLSKFVGEWEERIVEAPETELVVIENQMDAELLGEKEWVELQREEGGEKIEVPGNKVWLEGLINLRRLIIESKEVLGSTQGSGEAKEDFLDKNKRSLEALENYQRDPAQEKLRKMFVEWFDTAAEKENQFTQVCEKLKKKIIIIELNINLVPKINSALIELSDTATFKEQQDRLELLERIKEKISADGASVEEKAIWEGGRGKSIREFIRGLKPIVDNRKEIVDKLKPVPTTLGAGKKLLEDLEELAQGYEDEIKAGTIIEARKKVWGREKTPVKNKINTLEDFIQNLRKNDFIKDFRGVGGEAQKLKEGEILKFLLMAELQVSSSGKPVINTTLKKQYDLGDKVGKLYNKGWTKPAEIVVDIGDGGRVKTLLGGRVWDGLTKSEVQEILWIDEFVKKIKNGNPTYSLTSSEKAEFLKYRQNYNDIEAEHAFLIWKNKWEWDQFVSDGSGGYVIKKYSSSGQTDNNLNALEVNRQELDKVNEIIDKINKAKQISELPKVEGWDERQVPNGKKLTDIQGMWEAKQAQFEAEKVNKKAEEIITKMKDYWKKFNLTGTIEAVCGSGWESKLKSQKTEAAVEIEEKRLKILIILHLITEAKAILEKDGATKEEVEKAITDLKSLVSTESGSVEKATWEEKSSENQKLLTDLEAKLEKIKNIPDPDKEGPKDIPTPPPSLKETKEKFGEDYFNLKTTQQKGRQTIVENWKTEVNYYRKKTCRYCPQEFEYSKSLEFLAASQKVEAELKNHEDSCSYKEKLEEAKAAKQNEWEKVKKSTERLFYACRKCWGKIELDKGIGDWEQAKIQARADVAYHEEHECGQDGTKKIAIYFSPNQGGNEHADLFYAEKIKEEELRLEKDNQGEIYQEKIRPTNENSINWALVIISVDILLAGALLVVWLVKRGKKRVVRK